MTVALDWNEELHPRDKGKFAPKDAEKGAQPNPTGQHLETVRGRDFMVSPNGMIDVYHGTTADRAKGIEESGLKKPEGTGPGWFMVTSDPLQAAQYADRGREGDHVVVHFQLSKDDAVKYLTSGRPHDVYDHEGLAHGLMGPTIPPEFIHDVTPTSHIGASQLEEDNMTASAMMPDMPMMPDIANEGTPFNALLCVEGLETSDGRMFELGTTTWRDTPLPFMVQDTTPHGPDQIPEPAWAAGQIDQVYRDPNDPSRIMGRGHLMPNAVGQRAQELMQHAFRGVSVDAYGSSALPPDVQPAQVDQDGQPISVLVRYSDSVISRATMVPTPAFESCCAWTDDEGMPEVAANAHGAVIPDDTPPEVVVMPNAYEQLVASAGGPENPPRGWFFTPEPNHYQPLEVTPQGHITGHIAAKGQCHIGYIGKCETAPMSTTVPPFKAFHRTVARCDDNTEVACGWLAIDTKHQWDFGADADATADYYDHTGTLVAKLRASNGKHGIWTSGAVVPGLGDREAWLLQGPEVSGDWRRYVDPETNRPHNRELLSVLAVPVPGFPGTRTRPELLVASGEVVAQRGLLEPCDCEEAMTPEERSEFDALRAEVAELRTLVASGSSHDTLGRMKVDSELAIDTDELDALVASLDGPTMMDVPLSAQETAIYWAKYDTEDRKKMAESGEAMPGGGYPIADSDDLKSAIRAVGRGSGNHDAIRRHIMKRAKAIGQEKTVPPNWQSDGSLKTKAA